jgi:LPXTG-motif cell wall-anchored protein
VRIYVHLSNGLGGQTDIAGNYAAWTDADILPSMTATITPDPAVVGSGVVHVTGGTALNAHSYEVYLDGVPVHPHWVLWCDTDDFAYSGYAAGQTLQVRTSSANDAVLATLELPTAALDDPPAPVGNAPAAGPRLAATGVDALPYLTLAALLLAAGAATVLLARRRRFAD